MQDTITQKLAQALQPLHLDVVNESHKHHGHAGDDGSGESHFFVLVVSDMFVGKSRIERQKMVYKILERELKGEIHALSLKTMTMDEYNRV